MPPDLLGQRTIAVQQWGIRICQDMMAAINKLGFDENLTPFIDFRDANFELHTTPSRKKRL